MKALNEREQRTVRLGGIGLAVYLLLFFGVKALHGLGALRADYDRQVRVAHTLKAEVHTYETRTARLKRLMERLRLDPGTLSPQTVVSKTTAALQTAAMGGGLQLGPIRESPVRNTEQELGSIQFDATGQPQAITRFLAGLNQLGVPILVESVQLSTDSRGPGMLKMHLNLILLDFETWKRRNPNHA